MTAPVEVTYFSDVLCVWAYVTERRVEELRQELGDRVRVDYRMMALFGFARDMLTARYADKGGLDAYAAHVEGIVARFPHVSLHASVWRTVTPASSTPAHLLLAAVRSMEREGAAPPGAFVDTTWRARTAFFRDGRDVAQRAVLFELAEEAELDVGALEARLDSGVAHAGLARDEREARDLDVRVSPTMLMNEGRQRMVGNVGYRVIVANVRELLERGGTTAEHSWC